MQLSALESALSGVSLDHILPSAVVAGDVLHITSMLELIAELVKMPEGVYMHSSSYNVPTSSHTVCQGFCRGYLLTKRYSSANLTSTFDYATS